MHVQRLDWDTEFFGLPIGRLVIDDHDDDDDHDAGLAAVRVATEQAAAEGISCLYASVDPSRRALAIALAQAGFMVMEVGMDLVRPAKRPDHLPSTDSVARFGSLDDLPALADEIALMAPWSRFAMDPRFGLEAARRMHHAWVERAAGPDPHRWLVVAEDDQGISGFSTMSRLPDQDPRIDLIASTRPGSGAAYAIVDFEHEHFGDVRNWGGPIAARNVASLRFVENLGYRVGRVQYVYHRWLD